jgi:uncharacterized protein (UPF0276 family)
MGDGGTRGTCPYLGYGLRLQREFIGPILRDQPEIDWLEIISDNWLQASPAELQSLQQLSGRLPLVLHGMSLGIGGSGPLDLEYLTRLKSLAEQLRAPWISDHLCSGPRREGHALDLSPLPRTRASVAHLLPRIREVQQRLERPLLLENIPQPAAAGIAELDDWTFIADVAEGSDSLILLDLDNLYLSALAERLDPLDLLARLPAERICQLHLGSRPDSGELPVAENPVWRFFQRALDLITPVNTMLEPTNSLPPLANLLEDLRDIRSLAAAPVSG